MADIIKSYNDVARRNVDMNDGTYAEVISAIGIGKRKIGTYRVFNVEVIPNQAAVTANIERLPPDDGAHQAGYNPLPVHVATAEDITASRDCDRQLVVIGVHLAYQVSAGFTDIVRVAPLQRGELIVGCNRITISLVT